MGLKELRGQRSSSLLDNEGEDVEDGGSSLKLAFLAILVFSLLSMITVGALTFVMLDNHKSPVNDPGGVDVTKSTTTTTSTTTITIPTTTTTTTTTSTTTTTLCGGEFQTPCGDGCSDGYVMGVVGLCQSCGGEFQLPCDDGNCSDGYMLGNMNVCQPVTCNPSILSGKEGCGSWALNFCR
jgi:hypothetical protein